MNNAYIINDDSLTLYHQGEMHHVSSDNMNFLAIKKAILEKRYDDVIGLLNPLKVIEDLSNGILKVIDNNIHYKNDVLPEVLVNRLLDIIQHGITDLTSYLKFCENNYNNPSRNSREELYKFISHKDMPITEDGCILGYKGVSGDYMDRHSGTFRNMPGDMHEMPRRDVDDNCERGCSYGFHVGSKAYADNWAGADGKLLIVKYDPADAVSVPNDSNFEKLRVCKYEVVSEVDQSQRSQRNLVSPVYDTSSNSLQAVEGTASDTNMYSDEWYKARNYIESARDDGELTIPNRVLDELFNVSSWSTSDWDDLVEDTCTESEQWELVL